MILRVHGDDGCYALSRRLRLKVKRGAGSGRQEAPSVQVGDIHVQILHRTAIAQRQHSDVVGLWQPSREIPRGAQQTSDKALPRIEAALA